MPTLAREGTDRLLPAPCDGAAAASALAGEVVADRTGFDRLEGDWNALFARAGRPTHVFQTFNWCWHWCNHFLAKCERPGKGPQLAVVVVREAGRPVLIWPLVAERQAGLWVLSWLGEPVSQYGDILLDPLADRGAACAAAWATIRRELAPDLLRLRKVRADADVAPFLAGLGGLVTDRQEAPSLALASAPDFASYELRYGSKARKNRRRLRRRLDQHGSVAFEFLPPGSGAREAALQGLAIKRAWLADRGLPSPALADRRIDGFFADCAEGAVRPTGCRVSRLLADGGVAAVEIAFSCQRRLAVHLIAYGLAFERCGAGVLHMEESIRRGFAEGYASYDLLAPRSDYKMDWADESTEVLDHAIALSRRGGAFARAYLGFVRQRLKTAIEALPARWRRSASALAGFNTAEG
jgi:CelD/BcsL family acetyltransferase involved in cellulose biosynthesis